MAAGLFGPSPAVSPVPLPEWALPLALVVAPLAFTVLLRAEARDAPAIVAAGILGFAGARAGALVLGSGLGALRRGLPGHSLRQRLEPGHRPARRVPSVPGILLLVPGSLGFKSLSSLVGRETVAGLEAAFAMILVAVSLAMGLVFANALLPPAPCLPPNGADPLERPSPFASLAGKGTRSGNRFAPWGKAMEETLRLPRVGRCGRQPSGRPGRLSESQAPRSVLHRFPRSPGDRLVSLATLTRSGL